MRQHLVVPGEVTDRQQLDAGVLLHLPVPGAQFAADGTEAGFIQLALPVRLKGFLEFAIATDARKSEVMGKRHGLSPVSSEWRPFWPPPQRETNSIYLNRTQVILMLYADRRLAGEPPCSNFVT